MPVASLVAACYSKACAPPPVGTGGSKPSASGQGEGKPWERKFAPKQWTRVKGQDIVDYVTSVAQHGVDRMSGATLSPEVRASFEQFMRTEAIEQAQGLIDRNAVVYVNGNVAMIDDGGGVMRPGLETIMSTIDILQTRHPHDVPVTVFLTEVVPGGDTKAYGATLIREDKDDPVMIFLKGETMNDVLQKPARMWENWHQNSQPSSLPEWGVAHEWGHTVDRSRFDRDWELRQKSVYGRLLTGGVTYPQISRYGRSNHREMFAEAFADWVLSDGQSSNEATQAVAKEFGL